MPKGKCKAGGLKDAYLTLEADFLNVQILPSLHSTLRKPSINNEAVVASPRIA